jgi:DNA-binding NarL/FixJ family response regulator
MENKKIKLIIVEDHAIFREGLKYILETIPEYEVVGEFDNGHDFLNNLAVLIPNVVLMDIDLPGISGIEATKQAIQKYPELKILSLSMHGDYDHYQKMIEAGAKGFVLKNAGINQLTTAINEINKGKAYFSQELLLGIIQSKESAVKVNYIEKLDISDREIEVLELICKGLSNKEIADKLFISIKTVEGHKSKLMLKTETKNTVSLVLFALKNKIITQ